MTRAVAEAWPSVFEKNLGQLAGGSVVKWGSLGFWASLLALKFELASLLVHFLFKPASWLFAKF